MFFKLILVNGSVQQLPQDEESWQSKTFKRKTKTKKKLCEKPSGVLVPVPIKVGLEVDLER